MMTSSSRSIALSRRAAHAALAAVALHASVAAAQTHAGPPPVPTRGSGTVSFAFTSFDGPFAISTEAEKANPAAYNSTGHVNGLVPFRTGAWHWTGDPDPTAPLGYVHGVRYFSGPVGSVSLLYDWAAPGSIWENVITFTPRPFTGVALGEDFVLGTLRFTNGGWYGGGTTAAQNTPTDLGFTITTTSSQAAFNQTISGTIRMVVNAPSPNDLTTLAGMKAEADWIYIDSPANIGNLGSLRVFDYAATPPGFTNVGSVDVVARFNSLHLVGLENVQGGFIEGSVAPLPPVPPTAVPEPATWALLGAGLAALGGVRRRRGRVVT